MRVKCAYCIRWFDSVDAVRRHEQDFHSKSKQATRRFDEVNPPISEMPQRAAQIDAAPGDAKAWGMSIFERAREQVDGGQPEASDAGSTSCDGTTFDSGAL
jgi:hypothetical protein